MTTKKNQSVHSPLNCVSVKQTIICILCEEEEREKKNKEDRKFVLNESRW